MESGAAPVRQSIASLCKLCIQSFNRLGKLLGSSDYKFADKLSEAALKDELGRFRVWVGNSGAHQSGRVSLDHRLREASHVHTKLAQLLWDLKKALDEGNDIKFVTKDICLRYISFRDHHQWGRVRTTQYAAARLRYRLIIFEVIIFEVIVFIT